jgi:hypothetical protein
MTNKSNKVVRFDGPVRVQEYPITLGNNPGGIMGGPPITIGWEVLSIETMSIKMYERSRRPLIRKSKQERTRLLSYLGFAEDEILAAERQAATIRTNRIESVDDPESSSSSFSLSSSSEFLVLGAATGETKTDGQQQPPHQQPSIAKLVETPIDDDDNNSSSSRGGGGANLLSFSSCQRSVQGTKAMLLFQKRHAIRQHVVRSYR